SEEHTSELQSQSNLVCRLLLEKKKRSAPPRWPAAPRPTASKDAPADPGPAGFPPPAARARRVWLGPDDTDRRSPALRPGSEALERRADRAPALPGAPTSPRTAAGGRDKAGPACATARDHDFFSRMPGPLRSPLFPSATLFR